ncbi:hypothetical protein [Selenomonas ruminantium]|uniref:hypothetical protein n=1 Tax=Selenomonas ruminantium TaxID=971 RepID=UPI0015694064|nr:hypothetical protein [Selenomonas ruminantium]
MLDDVTALGVFSVLYIIITYYYFRDLKMSFLRTRYDKEYFGWFAIIHVFLTIVFWVITKGEHVMAWVGVDSSLFIIMFFIDVFIAIKLLLDKSDYNKDTRFFFEVLVLVNIFFFSVLCLYFCEIDLDKYYRLYILLFIMQLFNVSWVGKYILKVKTNLFLKIMAALLSTMFVCISVFIILGTVKIMMKQPDISSGELFENNFYALIYIIAYGLKNLEICVDIHKPYYMLESLFSCAEVMLLTGFTIAAIVGCLVNSVTPQKDSNNDKQ